MSTLATLVTAPMRLRWWEWCKIAGGAGLIVTVASVLAGLDLPAAVVAVLLHFAADYTFQSAETAARKDKAGWHLLVHALTAGALPLAIAGLVAGDLPGVLLGVAVGSVSHWLIDVTGKYGLGCTVAGVFLDQVSHLAVILIVTMA
ncbi:MAG: DUF3307 domain-containing protein [Anaerolineae bacterium]|nr:DUF3307 domain-containing protein [Anaerolineae bacterium]